MNKLQKAVVTKLISVLVFTGLAVAGFVYLRGVVNRSEAKRAMQHLYKVVTEYKQKNGFLPPESFINRAKDDFGWHIRLGDLEYRGLWIDSESQPQEFLAYTRNERRSYLFGSKHLVLRLDGTIDWIEKKRFRELLAQQQSRDEIKRLQASPHPPAVPKNP